MLQLNSLTRLVKKKKRIGRGGERGGTSGRGHKGQKARSGGKVRLGFEGGQMPLLRRVPRRGFVGMDKPVVLTVLLQKINDHFAESAHVTKQALLQKGIIHPKRTARGQYRVKVLGGVPAIKGLVVTVDAFSRSAEEAIKKAGGEARIA